MLSMLRAELFRIVRSRYLLFYFGLFSLVALATPAAMWLDRVWPAFAETGFVEMPDWPLPSLQFYGVSFVAGSLLPMLASVMMVAFVSEDFKTGFVKNLVQARGGRTAYAVAVIACCVLFAAVSTALGMLLVEAALRVQGYVPAPAAPAEMLQWFAQVALCTSAYMSVSVLVAVLSGSEVLSAAAVLMVGGGMVESVLMMVLANVPGIPAVLRDCLDGYLMADMSVLTSGVVTDPFTYVQAVATIAVAGGLALAAMRRKSL